MRSDKVEFLSDFYSDFSQKLMMRKGMKKLPPERSVAIVQGVAQT